MFNKKPKTEEQFTPSDLSRLDKKEDRQAKKGKSIFQRFSARRSAKELSRTQRWKRRGAWILSALVVGLLIVWIISMITSQYGDLVISVERTARGKGITVCETKDIDKGVTILSADKVANVTNITY